MSYEALRKEIEARQKLTRYEVVLRVDNRDGKLDHQWSMTFPAENFGHAEEQALDTLRDNEDKDSYIARIELW